MGKGPFNSSSLLILNLVKGATPLGKQNKFASCLSNGGTSLNYSSQIVEVETVSLELIFSKISYIYSNVPLSFPNVEPCVFWSTEMTVVPKSTMGKRKYTSVSRFLTSIVGHTEVKSFKQCIV